MAAAAHVVGARMAVKRKRKRKKKNKIRNNKQTTLLRSVDPVLFVFRPLDVKNQILNHPKH
jgi:hypothetical protein